MKLAACQRFDPASAPMDWVVEPIKKRLCLEYGSSLTEDARRAGSVPVFGSNGCVGTHDTARVEGPGILVGRKGSVGEVHFSESEFWPIDTVYYVRRLGQDDWGFIYYLLGYLNLDLLNAATGVPGLTRRDAHDILGAFPDLEEQRRIAAALKRADEVIQKARAELDAARHLGRALHAELLGGEIDRQRRAKIPTKVGTLPMGWTVSPLKNLADIGSGVTLNQDRVAKENGCRYLTVAHVQRGSISNDDPRYLELSAEERKIRLLETGDVLVVEGHASSMEIGRAAMFEDHGEPTTFQNHLFRVRADRSQIVPKFLLHVLNSERVQRHWNAVCNTSSGLNTINRRNLRNVLVQHTDIDEQHEIIETLDAAEQSIAELGKKLKAFEELKRSMRQNLLTGKVRVPLSLSKGL